MNQDDDPHSNKWTATPRDLVKISFALEGESPMEAESMWAKPLGDGVFLLDNVPFFVYGVSRRDKLYAQRAPDGRLEFSGVAEAGGHSTYRVVIGDDASTSRANEYWLELEQLGCGRELASQRMWALDLPPEVDVHRVHELLERGEAEGLWDFEDSHVADPSR